MPMLHDPAVANRSELRSCQRIRGEKSSTPRLRFCVHVRFPVVDQRHQLPHDVGPNPDEIVPLPQVLAYVEQERAAVIDQELPIARADRTLISFTGDAPESVRSTGGALRSRIGKMFMPSSPGLDRTVVPVAARIDALKSIVIAT
jgi:hypothetical protein